MGAERLAGFGSVDRWLDNFEKEVSRRNCLYALSHFVAYMGKDPDDLVEEARVDPERMEASVKKFYRHLKKEGFAAKSRSTMYGGVRSFFSWNGVKFGRRPRGFGRGVTYEGRRLLSRVEVARMVDVSPSLRDKAVIAVAAWSAQREGVLRALRWGMVRKQVHEGKDIVVVRVLPVFLDERGENVNKAETEYMFAFGEEAVEYVDRSIRPRVSVVFQPRQ